MLFRRHLFHRVLAPSFGLGLLALASAPVGAADFPPAPTIEEATQFVAEAEQHLTDLALEA